MREIKRISFFEDLEEKKATIAYFLQEGPNTCNANCIGCYAGAGQVSFSTGRGIIDQNEAFIDISELIKNYRIIIRGTEILINPHYVPLLKLANNKIILTNGVILGRQQKCLDLLAKNDIINIVITYPFKNAPATYRQLISLLKQKDVITQGIKNVKQHEFPFVLQLSAIVTNDSLENSILETICEEAISLDADVLRFIPYVPMSGNFQVDKYALSEAERKQLIEKVTEFKKYNKEKLVFHTPGVLGLFPLRAEKKKEIEKTNLLENILENKLICPAGLYYFAISAIKKLDDKGRLYRSVTPCHFRMDAEIGKYYGGSDLIIEKAKVSALFDNLDRSDCLAQKYWTSRICGGK